MMTSIFIFLAFCIGWLIGLFLGTTMAIAPDVIRQPYRLYKVELYEENGS